MTRTSKPSPTPAPLTYAGPEATRALERRSWRIWVLTVSVAIAVVLGLGTAFVLFGNGTLRSPWPWEQTQVILVAGLGLAFLTLLLETTRKQRHLARLRAELWEAQRITTERLSRHFDRLVAILEVSRTMGSATDPQAVLDTITGTCLTTFDAERVSLMLMERDTDLLEVRAASGRDDTSKVVGAKVRVGQGVAGWVARNQQPLILGKTIDPARYEGFTPKANDRPMAAMVVPISLRGELVGVLNVTSFDPDTIYTDEDLQALMVFAENAGICCRHAEQAEWMRQTIRRLDSALLEQDRARVRDAA